MASYGDTQTIITRTGAEPETFGFDEEDGEGNSPEDQLKEFVDGLRERASSEVERYTSVVFDLFENHVDVVQGNGRRHISTRNDPVLEIHSLEEGGRNLEKGEDYRLVPIRGNPEENIGRLERIRRQWAPHREIEITYDWGYDDETRPMIVDQVVEDMVVSVLNEADAERQAGGLESESMDGYSASFALTDASERLTLTESMREKLKPLRRRGSA